MGETINLNQALDVFADNVDEIEAACEDNLEYKLSELKKPNPATCRSYNEYWVLANLYQMQKEQITNTYQNTIRRVAVRKQPPSPNQITVTDIERAKEHPIEQILNVDKPRGNISCPFHQDKNPSFQIKKNNTWTCYSCGEYGDSIDLYQKLHNTTFKEAVTKLT